MRGQEKRNIASLMRTRRCLVVIDDPQTLLDASALAGLCGPGSHVLVTTERDRQMLDAADEIVEIAADAAVLKIRT